MLENNNINDDDVDINNKNNKNKYYNDTLKINNKS